MARKALVVAAVVAGRTVGRVADCSHFQPDNWVSGFPENTRWAADC